jgi:cytochrome P450
MDMPSSLPFSKAFDYASGVVGDRFTNPLWKVTEIFNGGPMRRAVAEVKAFGRVVVRSAKQRIALGDEAKGEQDEKPQKDLISSLISHLPDDQIVADAAMNFLSAARDTTAQSLTWTFYNIMRHPKVEASIKVELSRNSSRARDLDNIENIQPHSFPTIYSTFAETLRLFPPVPFEIKESTADTVFPDGTFVPTGSVVLWVPWAMGRSTRIWGADALEFQPSRWRLGTDNDRHRVESNDHDATHVKFLQKSAYEHPVFNAGPRACLGKKMAELLAVYVIASLMRDYEFEECLGEGGQERISANSLTLPMEGGLPCRVRERVVR